jgi:uncharacterized protein (TIGR02679 family)
MRAAIDYFSRPGFRRLFLAAKRKIESLGRIGGEVRLSSLTPDEQEALSGLLAKNLFRQSSIAINLSELDEKLRETRFAIGLMDILNGLYDEEIKPNNLKKKEKEEKWNQLIYQLQSRSTHSSVRNWLSRLESGQGQGYRTLREWFELQDLIAFEKYGSISEDLAHVIRALDNLPLFHFRFERLPIFAACISGDPHFLDRDRLSGRLFYHGMIAVTQHWRYGNEANEIPENTGGSSDSRESSEAIRKQYQDAGLLLDDLSSFVFIAGVDQGGDEYSYGLTLRMVEKWWEKWSSMEERLKEIKRDISVVKAADSSRPLESFITAALYNGKVYITENPSVCSGILDRIQAQNSADVKSNTNYRHQRVWSPLICTSGQPSHAAIRLLDCLTRFGIHLFYSGDFDVKGMEMATALANRYSGHWNAWGLNHRALRYLKNHQNGNFSYLTFSEEERASLKRLEMHWDENLVQALGNTKVFEEMIFPYLWEQYRDSHPIQMG